MESWKLQFILRTSGYTLRLIVSSDYTIAFLRMILLIGWGIEWCAEIGILLFFPEFMWLSLQIMFIRNCSFRSSYTISSQSFLFKPALQSYNHIQYKNKRTALFDRTYSFYQLLTLYWSPSQNFLKCNHNNHQFSTISIIFTQVVINQKHETGT